MNETLITRFVEARKVLTTIVVKGLLATSSITPSETSNSLDAPSLSLKCQLKLAKKKKDLRYNQLVAVSDNVKYLYVDLITYKSEVSN